jgi:tetratricopeptide (TPR) repeat protein
MALYPGSAVHRIGGTESGLIGGHVMADARETLIEELFQQAADLPADQRDEFLAKRCGGDDLLRAEVQRLLRCASEAPRGFLEGSSAETARAVTEVSLLGQRIGRYRIIRSIAAGGMGAVYEAQQEDPRRAVALKLMRRGIASQSALRRFEHEAQLLARLRHPGIAQVYEAGTYDDGTGGVPYFAMEYIPQATPITEYATANKLTTRQRLELFIQVCDAVHHGHQKGIIHRDLKPSNILVDSAGQPKIIDFGVARSTDSDVALTTIETSVGQLIGTLQYMSPEQCAADPNDLDTRSDVYSLGVVLYELLCERVPYEVSSVQVFEATRVIREQTPTRPSTINRALRGDLETIVLKALEKDRERRYASASALAADVGRHLKHEPVLARPPSTSYRLAKFVRRNRVAVAAAAAIVLALVGGIIGTSWQAIRATRAEAEALALAESEALQKEIVKKEGRYYGGLYQFLTWNLGFPGYRDWDPKETTVLEWLDATSEHIAEQFGDQPPSEAAVRFVVGTSYCFMGEYESAIPHLSRSYKIETRLPGADPLLLMETVGRLCGSLHELGRTEEEARWWRTDVDLAAQFLQEKYPALGQAAKNMRDALIPLDRPDRPSDSDIEKHRETVRGAYEAAMPPDGKDGTTVVHLFLGVGLCLDHTFGPSEGQQRLVEAASEIARQLHGEDPIPWFITLWAARAPAFPEYEDKRVALSRELVEHARANMPSYHYFEANCEGVLGEALAQRGGPEDREEAVGLLVGSYRGIRDRRGPGFFRTTVALQRLAGMSSIQTPMGREHLLYLQHPDIWDELGEGIELETDPAALSAMAWTMVRYAGLDPAHYDIALQAAHRANELAPDDATIVKSLGVAQYRAGLFDEAVASLARSDALFVAAGEPKQPANRAFLAMAHHQLGHADEARAALQRLRKLMEDADNAGNTENQGFLREAEELIGADAASPA